MSDTAAQPEAAPAEGQGAESGEETALYEPFLKDVPEEIHEQLLPALKAQNAEFTKKFQSSSERLKPFEEAGILDQDPAALGQYLQLDQAMVAAQEGDPQAIEAIYQWWDNVGEALKFYEGDDGEVGEGEDDEEFDLMDMTPEKFREAVRKEAQQMVQPLMEQNQSREEAEAQAAAEAEVTQVVDGWISEVKDANPEMFSGENGEKVLEEVVELSLLHTDAENPVQAGLERYKELVGRGETSLFQKKQEGQTPAPEGAGRPATTPAHVTMKNAKDAALEYIRSGNQMQT